MRVRLSFAALWVSLLFLFSLAVPLSAAAEEGEYQILQARYGTSSRNVDVTSRLNELARSSVNFRVTNEFFRTDPAPKQVKVLRIFARARDGSTRTFEYREKSIVDGSMFSSWSSGNWGNSNSYRGGWSGGGAVHSDGGGYGNSDRDGDGDDGEYTILQARYGTYSRNIDVTERLKELARADRSFRASNEIFQRDPAPHEVKALRIFARGSNGQTRTFEYREDAMVEGSLFRGWSSGRWGGGYSGGWGESEFAGSNSNGYGDSRGGGRLEIVHASYGTSSNQIDVTYRLRSRVVNDAITARVDNNLAGTDPAPKLPKSLWVSYRVGGGGERHVRVSEKDLLRLP